MRPRITLISFGLRHSSGPERIKPMRKFLLLALLALAPLACSAPLWSTILRDACSFLSPQDAGAGRD
jgi:hypothetical protein